MKKKIAFFTKNLDIGGIERAIINYVNNIDKEKYEIYLFLDKFFQCLNLLIFYYLNHYKKYSNLLYFYFFENKWISLSFQGIRYADVPSF